MTFRWPTRAAAPAVALSLLAVGCADPSTAPAGLAPSLKEVAAEPPPPPPAQYVVIYKSGAAGLADPASASGVKLGDLRYANGAVFAHVNDPEALRDDANVERVVENFLSYPHSTAYPTSATYFARNWQWDMRQIRAHQVPAAFRGQGAKVCIIDSGIDESHRDLAGKVVARETFVSPAYGFAGPGLSPAPLDSNGHGSHVASTVTTNGIGIAPVAPRASLMNAKVFAATGGTPLASIWDAIAWCTDNGADVINMSLGGLRTLPLTPTQVAQKAVYEELIQEAREAGVVVVVSAGNDNLNMGPGQPRESWPAGVAGTVTVSASAPINSTFPFVVAPPDPMFDGKAGYSNFGETTDIWAPGGSNFINRPQANIVGVCSSFRHGGACAGGIFYMSIGGTSMAAPHVAGAAAVLTSRATTPKGLARTIAIENCLYNSGDPITILGVTRPRLNVLRAATEACPGL